MPEYIFKHPKREKYISIVQTMNEEHSYTDKAGIKWERVFTVPQAVVKEIIDEFNSHQYVDITKRKKGNVGDLLDFSEELSMKRAQKTDNGRDPVKDKFYDDWSAKRHGRIHPEDNREVRPKSVEPRTRSVKRARAKRAK
jgi:hypothetical protein